MLFSIYLVLVSVSFTRHSHLPMAQTLRDQWSVQSYAQLLSKLLPFTTKRMWWIVSLEHNNDSESALQ